MAKKKKLELGEILCEVIDEHGWEETLSELRQIARDDAANAEDEEQIESLNDLHGALKKAEKISSDLDAEED